MIKEIKDALADYPDLTASGFRTNTFADDRQHCDSPEFAEEVARALLWLSRHGIPQGKHAPSSYALKHTAEYWLRDDCGVDHAYISNGAFIVAAVIKGYTARRYGPANPNCELRS